MQNKIHPFIATLLIAFLLVSCVPTVVPVIPVNPSTAVTKLDFTNQSKAVYSVDGLQNQSVFLVKVNVSGSDIPSPKTGSVYSCSLDGRAVSVSEGETDSDSDSGLSSFPSSVGPRRIDSLPAQRYNANPPSPSEVIRLDGMARSISADSATSLADSAPPMVGSTQIFHVLNNSKDTWSDVTATLKKTGNSCYIWVVDDSYSESSTDDRDAKLKPDQINELADWFDKIYLAETNLLGYEYGGGLQSTDPDYGGKDHDPKISILLYDIDGDVTDTQKTDSGICGYFTGVDYQDAGTFSFLGTSYQSNCMEMFYIDSFFTDSQPQMMYSTLIHEFQHMINFNQKCVDPSLSGLESLGAFVNVPTWYNEMLSLMSEEVIGSSLGIEDKGRPWASWMSAHTWLYSQNGLDTWINDASHYAQSYAFGTYLLHNFGGARILREMELNSLTGTASVEKAVIDVNGNVVSFADIYRGYPEVLLFSAGYQNLGHSFHLSNEWTFNEIKYDCYPLDIGTVENLGYKKLQTHSYNGAIYPQYGISFRKLNYVWDLPSYGVSIHSDDRLQYVSGSASITVTAPSSPNVEMYIVVR